MLSRLVCVPCQTKLVSYHHPYVIVAYTEVYLVMLYDPSCSNNHQGRAHILKEDETKDTPDRILWCCVAKSLISVRIYLLDGVMK